jgi:3',5'-cyclic AMP phosphodiesterase CpdA
MEHLSPHRAYAVPNVRAVLAWISERGPDAVVHTGDIVGHDPDDPAERDFAHAFLDGGLDTQLHVIPGNHDVGGFSGPPCTPERVAAFCATWGSDVFVSDVGAWRLIGANVYRVGEPSHDDWLAQALDTDRPVAMFLHQPLFLDRPDIEDEGDWSVPVDVRRQLFGLVRRGRASVRIVASGHLHRTRHVSDPIREYVFGPASSFTVARTFAGFDFPVGVIEFELGDDGDFEWWLVEPPGVVRLATSDFSPPGANGLCDAAPLFADGVR